MSTSADRDEQAELRVLRETTARSAAQVGETLGALTGRVHASIGRTRATARRLRRPVLLAGVPVAVLLAVGLLALRRFTAHPR